MSKHHAPRHPKKVQKDKPRLLKPGSGYVQSAKYAMGKHTKHSTDPDNLLEGEVHGEPEPEAVDEETQKWITQEARDRFSVIKGEELHRREARSAAAQVRELYALARKTGSGLPEIQKAIEEARKRLGEAA